MKGNFLLVISFILNLLCVVDNEESGVMDLGIEGELIVIDVVIILNRLDENGNFIKEEFGGYLIKV